MGIILFSAAMLFLSILFYFIFASVILSWLQLFGVNFYPRIISDIVEPMYGFMRKIGIPTSFGPLDFSPIIAIIVISFLQIILQMLFPELAVQYSNILQ